MAYLINSSTITGGAQHEANLHLYLHQIHAGSNANQTVPVNPSTNNSFGLIAINDWTIQEGTQPSSKVIARARGIHTQSGKNKEQWYCSFNMVFEDDRFKGSTLEVRGVWDNSSPVELAIVGGTGQFTLAQGIVSGKELSLDSNTRIMDLSIHVFYRTIQK